MLLQVILDRMSEDLADAIGLSIVLQNTPHNDTPVILAARGIESEMIRAQVDGSGGPVLDALRHEVPVISLHLWTDERWPHLTRQAFARQDRVSDQVWDRVEGAAALPGIWGQECTLALTCTLSRPADATTITTLIGYEQLVCAALVAANVEQTDTIHEALSLVTARSAIEQAKGAIMGRLGCNAALAWARLRTASQQMDVKVSDLSVALLEYISDCPIENPIYAGTTAITPDRRTRAAAQKMWSELYLGSQINF